MEVRISLGEVNVSIVSGTYNRLSYMQRMVASVRYSVGILPYEIILVDGGSTDGTIKWCEKQPDITIIEQGELLGAVKAFNEGARAARGSYVILANDDIEFVGRSILRSWTFMEDYRHVGIGCFYQDRNRQSWHVETMPVVDPSGHQTALPYGQVCIVHKWLGDYVGWWGDYLHTYGGDNELSANVLELGYEVCPVEGAKIHDFSENVDDELRRINKGDPSQGSVGGGGHPDSAKWYKKWTYRRKTGPRVRLNPVIEKRLPDRRKRFLYAPIYEPGNKLQKGSKKGLREAMGRRGVVLECDYMSEGIAALRERACSICPDVFVLQIQDAQVFNKEIMQVLKHDHPNAKFVSWNGDYHPKNLFDPAYMDLMKEMDAAGFAVASIKDSYESHGINWFYWQIGYEVSNARPNKTTKHHDVVFLGNGYTRQRKDLAKFLLSLRTSGVDVGLYGSWPKRWSMGDNLYDFGEGEKIYKASKIAISDQQWPDATGYVSNRLFQAMAAGGCLVLQQDFKGLGEYLGLFPGIHLDIWENFKDLEEKIHDYLNDNTIRRRMMAKKGHEYMLENHSFDMRVRELEDVLGW